MNVSAPHAAAVRIVLDVLLLRGPDATDAPFRMCTADPAVFMSPERLAAARRFAAYVPRGTTAQSVDRVASTIAPLLTT